MKLFCALDRNRTYALRVSAGSSYQTELQGLTRSRCTIADMALGSGGRTRTRDPRLMKPVLYRLSYARIHAANSARTLSRAPLGTAPVFIFSPGGRTRTYNIHCIRVALSPIELRRKRRKQGGKRAPTPREHYMALRRRRQTNITSDRKEETKPATLVR